MGIWSKKFFYPSDTNPNESAHIKQNLHFNEELFTSFDRAMLTFCDLMNWTVFENFFARYSNSYVQVVAHLRNGFRRPDSPTPDRSRLD